MLFQLFGKKRTLGWGVGGYDLNPSSPVIMTDRGHQLPAIVHVQLLHRETVLVVTHHTQEPGKNSLVMAEVKIIRFHLNKWHFLHL